MALRSSSMEASAMHASSVAAVVSSFRLGVFCMMLSMLDESKCTRRRCQSGWKSWNLSHLRRRGVWSSSACCAPSWSSLGSSDRCTHAWYLGLHASTHDKRGLAWSYFWSKQENVDGTGPKLAQQGEDKSKHTSLGTPKWPNLAVCCMYVLCIYFSTYHKKYVYGLYSMNGMESMPFWVEAHVDHSMEQT